MQRIKRLSIEPVGPVAVRGTHGLGRRQAESLRGFGVLRGFFFFFFFFFFLYSVRRIRCRTCHLRRIGL